MATSASGPLSFQQADMVRRMLAHPECAPGYDEVLVFRLTGALDVGALEQAVESLVARHGALRTTIRAEGDEHVQRRDDHPVAEVERSALCGSVAELTTELEGSRLTVEEALAGRPLFRVSFHEEGNDSHLLAVRVHHLLYDGMSFPILWRDLGELYAAGCEQRAPELPELGLEYIDYARQQRAEWSSVKHRALPFWQSVTEGAMRPVEWPAPSELNRHEYACDTFDFDLSPGSAQAAGAVARDLRVSPFLVLLAATAGALSEVSGCDDLLIGTDVANRGSRVKRDLVGHFLSSRLTRFIDAKQRPVTELVAETRETWFAAEDHDEVYIEEVLAELGVPGFTPVHMQPLDGQSGLRLEGLTVESVDVAPWPYYWRDILFIWALVGRSFRCLVLFRPSRVSEWVPGALASAIERRLPEPATSRR